jgi:hypothetical protein
MFKNIIKTIAKAIVLIGCISSTSAYVVRPNIDFYGGDMYPIYSVNNSLSCLAYCESVRNCRLLTWCDNICYIKNKKVSEVEKLDCISIDMYPDDEIVNSSSSISGSSSWNGSLVGSVDGSSNDQNIISENDINTQKPTEIVPTLTPSPSPSQTPENTDNTDNIKEVNNASSSSRKLTMYASSVILSMIILF